MSKVTSALIIVDWMDNQELRESMLTQELKFSTSSTPPQKFNPLDLDGAGGYKNMQVDIYACAFNYVNADQLATWFKELPWAPHDRAFLQLTEENGNFWFVIKEPGVGFITKKDYEDNVGCWDSYGESQPPTNYTQE